MKFPSIHDEGRISIGLLLGFVICLGLILSTESDGDPDLVTGVSAVFPEVGIQPFAYARADFLEIDPGLPEVEEPPILTVLVLNAFSWFGLGVATLKIFSVLPFLFCILLIAAYLSKRRGDSVAILAALILALQPTFLPWASVPGTVPLASLSILIVVLLAGREGKYEPWKALALCILLSWGISPLIAIAYPACWLEGIRRLLPQSLQPKGWVITLLATTCLITLNQLGADAKTLAMGISGSTTLLVSENVPSILSIDPGWLIALIAALIAGPRGRDNQLLPLRILLVSGVLPWVLAGSFPVFPLIVLFPAGILLITDVLADRGRQILVSPILLGRGPKLAMVLLVLGVLTGASIATAASEGAEVRSAISLGLLSAMIGIVLTIRSGMKPVIGVWVAIVTTLALSMPINLHRIAHQEDRWKIYRGELDRILPAVATVGGRWAHALVVDSTRAATRSVDGQDHAIISDDGFSEELVLERYNLFGADHLLVRQRGVPVGIFENACALQAMGRRSEARSDLAKLLKVDPGCSAAWERFAVLLLEDGIEDLAAECLYFSLQSDPGKELSHRLLASLYASRGMLREASHHLVKSGENSELVLPLPLAPASIPLDEDRR